MFAAGSFSRQPLEVASKGHESWRKEGTLGGVRKHLLFHLPQASHISEVCSVVSGLRNRYYWEFGENAQECCLQKSFEVLKSCTSWMGNERLGKEPV